MATTSKWLDAIMTGEGNPKLLPVEFSYRKTTISSYHIYQNEGTAQYAIYVKYNADSLPKSEWIRGTNIELLHAMLNLWRNIGKEIFVSLRNNSYLFVGVKRSRSAKKDNKKWLLDDSVFQKIIGFCNKYGYPFSLNGIDNKVEKKRFLNLPNSLQDCYEGFYVTDFLRELDEVYGAYCLVQRIINKGKQVPIDKKAKISVPVLSPNSTYLRPIFNEREESEIISAYKQFGGKEISIEEFSNRIHKCCVEESKKSVAISFKTIEEIEKAVYKHNNPGEEDNDNAQQEKAEKDTMFVEEECGELFLQKFKSRSYENQVMFDGGLFLGVRSSNLFDAAFYELAQMLILPKQNIKLCPICRTYFIPKNGHQKYCDTWRNGRKTCYPEKMYKRKNYKPRNKKEKAVE